MYSNICAQTAARMDAIDQTASRALLDEARSILQQSLTRGDLVSSATRVPYQTSKIVDELHYDSAKSRATGADASNLDSLKAQNKALCAHVRELEAEIRAYAGRFQQMDATRRQLASEVALLREDKLVLRAKLDAYDAQARELYLCKKALRRLQREKAVFDESDGAVRISTLEKENMQLRAELSARDALYARQMHETPRGASESPSDVSKARTNEIIARVDELAEQTREMGSKIELLHGENAALEKSNAALQQQLGRLREALQ